MRIFWPLVLFVLILPSVCRAAVAQPHIEARAAVLVEASTGIVLYEKSAYTRYPPASTTKILTALVATDRLRPGARIRVSRHAAGTAGSRAHIRYGETYSRDELLKGLLMRSGNDAATALAEGAAGSEKTFADLSNRRAAELGALGTHVVNPHGLDRPDHLMTARDLALLAAHLLSRPDLAAIVSTADGTFGAEGRPARGVSNTNRLLGFYPGAIGVKTGTTSRAGKCLVAAARRDGMTLIAVVLASPDRWGESARLLDWGFDNFHLVRSARAGERLATGPGPRPFPIVADRDLLAVLPVGEEARPALDLRPSGSGGARRGERLGTVALIGRKGVCAVAYAVMGGRAPARSGSALGDRVLAWVAAMRRIGLT